MDYICHQRANHAVCITGWNRDHQRIMMGDGGWFPTENTEREIAKTLIDSTNTAEFSEDWVAFLAARRGTPRELVMRRFMEAMALGGLTEIEARDAIINRTCLRLGDCVSHAVIDGSALPTDRYFREAWEWSD